MIALLRAALRSATQLRSLKFAIALIGASALNTEMSYAGGIVPCQEPFIFEGPAANIVPLEFLATSADLSDLGGTDSGNLQETAQKLAWLVKLDSWHQPTYGSLGVVLHLFLGEICPPDQVIDGLLRGGDNPPIDNPPIRSGQILVFLQGKIFIEGKDIFLQSRLRGFRRNGREWDEDERLPPPAYFERETLSTGILGSADGVSASLPLLDVTFAPRALTREEFEKINDEFASASRVYDAPEIGSHYEELVFDAVQPQAFTVQILDDEGWLRIDGAKFGGPSGYIQSDPAASAFLHKRLPELDFLNGLLGVLRLRQERSDVDFSPPPKSTAKLASNSLTRFLENGRTDDDENGRTEDDAEARALAHALIGAAIANQGDWKLAREHFLRASELSVASSEYRNLLGVTDARLCCAEDPSPGYRDPALWFADSLAVSPENGEALRNLATFLEALKSRTDVLPTGLNFERLDDRLNVVRDVVAENPDLVRRP